MLAPSPLSQDAGLKPGATLKAKSRSAGLQPGILLFLSDAHPPPPFFCKCAFCEVYELAESSMRLGRNTPFGGTGTLACADVAALRMPHSQEWLCHMTAARALRSRRIDGGSPKARTLPWRFFCKCSFQAGLSGIVLLTQGSIF